MSRDFCPEGEILAQGPTLTALGIFGIQMFT